VAFLNRLQSHLPDMAYHVARKKIPCIDDKGQPVQPSAPNGIKLEVSRPVGRLRARARHRLSDVFIRVWSAGRMVALCV